ncbi:hypothetical protein HYW20_01695 [Candidatus Woesearchaeota archaeon]|nr:hypothetical protein [Candidatus Woesearchaeota archaeon]
MLNILEDAVFDRFFTKYAEVARTKVVRKLVSNDENCLIIKYIPPSTNKAENIEKILYKTGSPKELRLFRTLKKNSIPDGIDKG